MDQPQANQSRLLVLSNREQDFQQIQTLLSLYFPSPKQGEVLLDTRYYRARVQVGRMPWPGTEEVVEGEMVQQKSTGEALMIMLVNDSDSFPSAMYDYVISKHNPENFILIVNTKHRNTPWQDEERIKNEVNNFIEVIKEDLQGLCAHPPQRVKTGLLADAYEDGNFFNLLELMETTSWPHIERKVLGHKEEQGARVEAQAVKEEKKEEMEPQEEMTDQQLQSEMKSFELMMAEMQSLKLKTDKFQGISDDQRKRKAQSLISLLLGGNL